MHEKEVTTTQATATEHVDQVQPVKSLPTQLDLAAEFLKQQGVNEIVFTKEEEEAVRRKVDLRLLPLLLLAYFFQQLDKSTLSYSSVFGIVQDAHLVGKQFSWLGSVLYLAQLVAQPLAAVVLVKLPTGRVLFAIILLWGSTLAAMTAGTNFRSLLGLRFALGFFEALIGEKTIANLQSRFRS